MADTSQQFTIVAAPGFGASNGFVYDFPLGPTIVEKIIVNFPPGCAGQVFVQVLVGGSARYPSQTNSRFWYDDYVHEINVTNSPDTGDWSVLVDNTGFVQHLIQVEFYYNWLTNEQSSSSLLPASL